MQSNVCQHNQSRGTKSELDVRDQVYRANADDILVLVIDY